MKNLFNSIFGRSEDTTITDMLTQGAVLIDVRSAGEFAGGHAAGAINIPLDELDRKSSQIKSYQKPIVLCCASGMRSARAKALLAGKGIPDLYDGGSWRNLK